MLHQDFQKIGSVLRNVLEGSTNGAAPDDKKENVNEKEIVIASVSPFYGSTSHSLLAVPETGKIGYKVAEKNH